MLCILIYNHNLRAYSVYVHRLYFRPITKAEVNNYLIPFIIHTFQVGP